MTIRTISGVWVSLLIATGCASDVGEVGSSSASSGATEPRHGDWDEARSIGADPCGGATLDTCDGATRGACGVVSDGADDLCLPLFPWGVDATGTIELASTERIFTLRDLATRPLSAGERAEALQLQADLAEALVNAPADDALEPLTSIDHSGKCSTSFYFCNSSYIGKYWYHYNNQKTGYHQHVNLLYRSLAWPACLPSSAGVGSTTHRCGTW